MASIPGRHDEVQSFVRKFLNLHGAGRDARLNLDSHGGQLWVSLHAKLGEQPGQAVPLFPHHGAVPARRQTKSPPLSRRRHRNGGRPSREARRARRVLATFLSLPFYLCEADETPAVNHAPALHSAETVEVNSNAAELVDVDTTPTLPPSHTPAPLHIRNDDTMEAAARRHACRERDARQSLALSEPDAPPIESPAAVPVRYEAETMLDGGSPDNSLGSEVFSSCDEPRRGFDSPDRDASVYWACECLDEGGLCMFCNARTMMECLDEKIL